MINEQWRDGLRILCVRLDNLGDVLMTTPAFRAMKSTWPNSHLTLLTSSAGAGIGSYIPDIHSVIRFDVPWVLGEGNNADAVIAMAAEMNRYDFDAAVVFTVQSQNPLPAAMLCYLAGIPRVLGYCRENPYQLMTDWVPDPEILVATRHEVERQLALVETVGCQRPDNLDLQLSLGENDRNSIRQLLESNHINFDRPWLILHPGVSEAKRRYPVDQFAQIAQTLIDNHGYQVVLTGTASEYGLAESIQTQVGSRAVNLAGQLALGQFIALIAEAPLLLANNTGPVHIAAAVQTPVVVVYAKTNPQHTPWHVPSQVLYIDVPSDLRSRNVLLQQFPEPAGPTASPEAVTRAVVQLMTQTALTGVGEPKISIQ
ncbi:MAG TPA: lipopolysaccharide heptosyltransferase II [Fibrella sp.]